MSAVIDVSDTEWAPVADLFDPPGREGKPARYPRRDVVDAMGSAASARAWLEVAAVAYLFARLRVEPA